MASAPWHNYATFDACPHPDCGGTTTGPLAGVAQGYQAQCCGHYYPRNRVAIDRASSEPYCRNGMGCQAGAK